MTFKKKTLLLIVLCLLLVGTLAARKAWTFYYDRKVPNFSETKELYVYPGTRAEELARYILDSCRVRSAVSFRRAFNEAFAGADPKPGHYTVTAGNTSMYVARMLSRGWQTPAFFRWKCSASTATRSAGRTFRATCTSTSPFWWRRTLTRCRASSPMRTAELAG